MLDKKVCAYCGRECVSTSHIDSKYCSKQCSQADYHAHHPNYYKEWRAKKKPILEKECRNCGKKFKTTNSIKIFCSDKCKVIHFNATRPTTRNELRICPICQKVFRPMQKTGVGRTYCTPICRNKAMNQTRQAATQRKRWNETKKKWKGNWWKALERDQFTCQICGRKRKPWEQVRDKRYILEVHHKDSSGETGQKNHQLENLLTLCAECHREFHTKINLIQKNGEYFIKGNIFKILALKSIKTIY